MWGWVWQNADKLGNLAQVLTGLIAGIALGFAWAQVSSTRKSQEQATAYASYRDYLKLAFDNPKFANPELGKVDCDHQTFDGDRHAFEKYEWFVSIMLHGCEEVWLTTRDGDWRRTVESQIGYHKAYLNSDYVRNAGWLEHLSSDFRVIVQEALQ